MHACMHAYTYKFTESQGRAGRAPATTYIAHKKDAGGWYAVLKYACMLHRMLCGASVGGEIFQIYVKYAM